MKLTIICGAFSGGGAELVAINLANHYSQMGDDINFLVFSDNGPYKEKLKKSINVVNLKTRARYALIPLRRFLKNDTSDCYLSVTRETNIIAGLANSGLGKKMVFREANTLHAVQSYGMAKRHLFSLLMKIAYKGARTIICNSKDTENDILNQKITSQNKTVIIGNPVLPSTDILEKLINAPPPHPWLNNPDLKVFLNVGRLHPQKNQKLLMRAFQSINKKYKNCRLLILGEGALHRELEYYSKELGIESNFEICQFDNNPFPYYKNSSAFVLTSKYEGFGNVLVEALASGTPVISTNCPGGPSSILKDGMYGQLITNGSSEQLIAAMENIITNSHKSTKENQVSHALQYSVEQAASTYRSYLAPKN